MLTYADGISLRDTPGQPETVTILVIHEERRIA
jgi:hypothetical protein